MNKWDKLREEFPDFYASIPIECGPGWYELLADLSRKLMDHLKGLNQPTEEEFYIDQVKEKYGTLRFYTTLSDEVIDKLIDEAEEKSSHTCELCGKQGTLIEDRGWSKVRCATCMQEIEARRDKDR